MAGNSYGVAIKAPPSLAERHLGGNGIPVELYDRPGETVESITPYVAAGEIEVAGVHTPACDHVARSPETFNAYLGRYAALEPDYVVLHLLDGGGERSASMEGQVEQLQAARDRAEELDAEVLVEQSNQRRSQVRTPQDVAQLAEIASSTDGIGVTIDVMHTQEPGEMIDAVEQVNNDIPLHFHVHDGIPFDDIGDVEFTGGGDNYTGREVERHVLQAVHDGGCQVYVRADRGSSYRARVTEELLDERAPGWVNGVPVGNGLIGHLLPGEGTQLDPETVDAVQRHAEDGASVTVEPSYGGVGRACSLLADEGGKGVWDRIRAAVE